MSIGRVCVGIGGGGPVAEEDGVDLWDVWC